MSFLRIGFVAMGLLAFTACGGKKGGDATTPAPTDTANPCGGGETAPADGSGGEAANPCGGGEAANPCGGGQ